MQQERKEIERIVEERYNGYRGTSFKQLEVLHNAIRESVSEKDFLAFLKNCDKINPRPVYKIPSES